MMDAYHLHKELMTLWQQLALNPDAASIKKDWNTIGVYVGDQVVTGIEMIDGKITLQLGKHD